MTYEHDEIGFELTQRNPRQTIKLKVDKRIDQEIVTAKMTYEILSMMQMKQEMERTRNGIEDGHEKKKDRKRKTGERKRKQQGKCKTIRKSLVPSIGFNFRVRAL